MYTVLDYGRMAADGVRMDAYARAIAQAVKPGDVVLDLGAGTGIFSLLAVRAGASHVHAVEPNSAIWVLPELAAENGVADRITIHPKSSFDVELPKPADVLVSDMRGWLPLLGDHTAALEDARSRLLRPGGTLIPKRDRLIVAVAESESLWSRLARGWESFARLGYAGEAARRSILNTMYSDNASPVLASDVLTTAEPWATIDYATYDGATLEGTVQLTATRSGVAHGLSVWFEATLLDGIDYSTAPGWSLAYGRSFFPFLKPVALARGDAATVTLRADARGDRWAWETELKTAANVASEAKTRFRQSTFFGMPTSPEALLRLSSTFHPRLSPSGERARTLLGAMNGERSVAELASDLAPPDASAALKKRLLHEVHEIVERYTAG